MRGQPAHPPASGIFVALPRLVLRKAKQERRKTNREKQNKKNYRAAHTCMRCLTTSQGFMNPSFTTTAMAPAGGAGRAQARGALSADHPITHGPHECTRGRKSAALLGRGLGLPTARPGAHGGKRICSSCACPTNKGRTVGRNQFGKKYLYSAKPSFIHNSSLETEMVPTFAPPPPPPQNFGTIWGITGKCAPPAPPTCRGAGQWVVPRPVAPQQLLGGFVGGKVERVCGPGGGSGGAATGGRRYYS